MPVKSVPESHIVNVGQLFYSPEMNKWDGALNANTYPGYTRQGIRYAYVRNSGYKFSGCRNKGIQHPCEHSGSGF
jgi:hypothetical protein